MSHIDDLLNQHCPDGVEYLPLGAVAEVQSGWGFPNADQGAMTGDIPFYKVSDMNLPGNELVMHRANNYVNREVAQRLRVSPAPAGTVIFPKIGAAVATNKKRLLSVASAFDNNVMGLVPGTAVLPKFLFYWMQTVDLVLISNDSGAVPSIRKSSVQLMRIPVPPVAVQREIVRILDQFTQLEAELEAELEARRRQFEHYLHTLLLPRGGETVWRTLGEVGKVQMCKRVFKNETSPEGDIPFYKIGTFGGTPDAYITQELYERYRSSYPFPKKGDVLISAAGTIGRAIPYDGRPAFFQDSNIVWIDNDESIVLNKYLYFWYQIIKWTTDGGTIRRLYNQNIRNALISVPSLREQARIVDALDKFEALVNDLNSGLPAELAARRKQYEYYRDRLLTFQEAA